MAEEKKPTEDLVDDEDLLDPNDFDDEDDKSSDTDDQEDENESEKSKTDESKSDEESEKAKNAHYAKLRREREAREKAAKEKREQEAKERKIRVEAELGIIKVNPYTEEPIRDEEDLKVYKLQKELDEEGKDPIADLGKKIAELNRAESKKRADEEAKQKQDELDRRAKIDAEIKELVTKYPKVDTAKLAEDPIFKECLSGRAGRWSQLEIYELYLVKKAEADKKAAEEKNKQKIDEESKKMTKTPGSGSTTKSASDIASMSDEEFEKYWNEHYA